MNCKLCNKNIDSYNERSQLKHVKIGDNDFSICKECAEASGSEEQAVQKVREKLGSELVVIEEKKAQEEIFKTMIISTTPTIEGRIISEYYGIVGAQTMHGINMFKDVLSGIRNVVGGRSKTMQKVMKQMREEALIELREEAFIFGANAVVGIKLDFDEYSEGMIMLSITGTAVLIS